MKQAQNGVRDLLTARTNHRSSPPKTSESNWSQEAETVGESTLRNSIIIGRQKTAPALRQLPMH